MLHPAAGPDGLLAPALKLIFSQSLTQGIFPSALKRAVIVPILKSGDKAIPGNYRPISLTSCISKVVERIIRKHVLEFLERKGLLNNTQHGFRSGRSCLSCLSALLNVFDNGDRLIYTKPDVSPPLPKETVIGGHPCRIWHKSQIIVRGVPPMVIAPVTLECVGHMTLIVGSLPFEPTTIRYQTITCAPSPLVNGSSVVPNMPTNGKM